MPAHQPKDYSMNSPQIVTLNGGAYDKVTVVRRFFEASAGRIEIGSWVYRKTRNPEVYQVDRSVSGENNPQRREMWAAKGLVWRDFSEKAADTAPEKHSATDDWNW